MPTLEQASAVIRYAHSKSGSELRGDDSELDLAEQANCYNWRRPHLDEGDFTGVKNQPMPARRDGCRDFQRTLLEN